jgi:hypothetical protein
MTTINEIFRTFGPEYLERYAKIMPKIHRKVIAAISGCHTEVCGLAIYQCEKCGEFHRVYRSCGNRHCPTCQHHKTRQWLEKQIKRQLPGHHFLLTFTVPEKLRRFIRKNQRIAYSALFKASSEAIKKLALDEKYIGGDLPGFLGVLHTWGRTLEYHPHIHYIVPGGALSTPDGLWHPSRIDFYLPVRALSMIFKAKFRDAMKETDLFDEIPSEIWQLDWNVNSQAVGGSETSLKYLAPYVFKVAISGRPLMTTRPRHLTPIFLKSQFPWQKWPFKAPKRPLFYTFFFHFRCLAWSDPALYSERDSKLFAKALYYHPQGDSEGGGKQKVIFQGPSPTMTNQPRQKMIFRLAKSRNQA